MNPANSNFGSSDNNDNGEATVDWEMRPGGMLVQKREDSSETVESLIKIRVCHDTSQHELSVPAQTTFGELKKILAQMTALEPQDQRLLFRGKERGNEERLHSAGVKDTSKIVLLQDPASRERKHAQQNMNQEISKASEAVVIVRSEVDKLAEKVAALESAVNVGTKVEEKEFLVLTEFLMVQLLKLDGIEAEGEAKAQRKIEVKRVQSFVDKLDALKARNSKPFVDGNKSVSVTTEWETFDSGVGSLNAPPSHSPSKPTEDWEQFE